MSMHSITKFLEAANQNAAEVNRKVVEITQRNLNLGFELAKSLARGAGNPTEIVRVQTSFWRKQFDELATQAEEARNRLFGFNVARPKKLEVFARVCRRGARQEGAHSLAKQGAQSLSARSRYREARAKGWHADT